MRRLRLISIIIIILMAWDMTAYSQSSKRNGHSRTFKRAMIASENRDYITAIELYTQILDRSPDNIDALVELGICLIATNQKLDTAIDLFRRALGIIPEEDFYSAFGIELQRAIAFTHNLNYEPEQALRILSVLKDSVADGNIRDGINEEIMQTRNAALLLKNPVPLTITNLGGTVNSGYDDHSPLVSLYDNRLFFTSRRPVDGDRVFLDGQFPEKVFVAEFDGDNWKEPKIINELYSGSEHKSVLSLSPDGTQIFLFKNDRRGKNIYVSHFRNSKWQEPERLPEPINSKWDETHASLSPDQSTLFFTSNRPGGYGGLDIYMVKKDKYGNWGEAVNLGPHINTDKDEETPMLHPDGQTLYFASEGHSSMGGFDIFFSQKQTDNTWALPVNMGYPVNSPDDDFFFVPSLDKSLAYFSSFRFTKNVGRSDIYKVNFDSTYNGSLAVIEGTIRNSDNLPTEHIRVLVSRESDNQHIGDFRPNPNTGKYLLFLEAGHNYIIQEATPESVDEEVTIHVHEDLAYNEYKKVVMVQDYQMLSPMIPLKAAVKENDHYLTQISTTEEAEVFRNNTTYTVQILALKKTPNVGSWFFKGLNVESVKAHKGADGFLRYVTGQFENKETAEKYLSEIQRNGRFRDAWVREYESLENISNECMLIVVN